MTVRDMAEQYYPRLWDISRLKALVEAGRLSREDMEQIIAEHEKEGESH